MQVDIVCSLNILNKTRIFRDIIKLSNCAIQKEVSFSSFRRNYEPPKTDRNNKIVLVKIKLAFQQLRKTSSQVSYASLWSLGSAKMGFKVFYFMLKCLNFFHKCWNLLVFILLRSCPTPKSGGFKGFVLDSLKMGFLQRLSNFHMKMTKFRMLLKPKI